MKSSVAILIFLVIILNNTASGQPVLTDNFDDNLKANIWDTLYIDVNNCWLEETNQQLEIRSTGTGDLVAAYISTGWLLVPDSNFQIRVDFSHNIITSDYTDAMIVISNSDDLENNHMQFAASSSIVDYGEKNYYFELVHDGNQLDEAWMERTDVNGTLYLSYDYNLDELYLSFTDYGSGNAAQTLSGLIRGTWFGKPIRVAIGGSADNQIILSGEIYLDNFKIEQGNITYCTYNLTGDLNDDCKFDFLDFAIVVENWLIDCDQTPADPSCQSK